MNLTLTGGKRRRLLLHVRAGFIDGNIEVDGEQLAGRAAADGGKGGLSTEKAGNDEQWRDISWEERFVSDGERTWHIVSGHFGYFVRSKKLNLKIQNLQGIAPIDVLQSANAAPHQLNCNH